jgi:hypothetical protein
MLSPLMIHLQSRYESAHCNTTRNLYSTTSSAYFNYSIIIFAFILYSLYEMQNFTQADIDKFAKLDDSILCTVS